MSDRWEQRMYCRDPRAVWEQRMYCRDPRAVSGSTGENGSEHLVQEAVEERCE